MSLCLSVSLSVCVCCLSLSICLSVNYRYVFLSVFVSVCVCPSVCLSVLSVVNHCLSVVCLCTKHHCHKFLSLHDSQTTLILVFETSYFV